MPFEASEINPLPKRSTIYKVVVDYGKMLNEMIKVGNYGSVNDDINDKNFPSQESGKSEVELVLVHLNEPVTTKEVLAHLNEQGLEPAKIEHLLSFGAEYPDVQREFPVVALGSVWVLGPGSRSSPDLHYYDSERRLSLYRDGDGRRWEIACRFLAIRKAA